MGIPRLYVYVTEQAKCTLGILPNHKRPRSELRAGSQRYPVVSRGSFMTDLIYARKGVGIICGWIKSADK